MVTPVSFTWGSEGTGDEVGARKEFKGGGRRRRRRKGF